MPSFKFLLCPVWAVGWGGMKKGLTSIKWKKLVIKSLRSLRREEVIKVRIKLLSEVSCRSVTYN